MDFCESNFYKPFLIFYTFPDTGNRTTVSWDYRKKLTH